jgi:hypothetical protein
MITQAWNIYSFAIPIVHQFFGIQPKASEKKVQIIPQLPEQWNEASLENVVIADNKISVFFEKKDKRSTIKVSQTNKDWNLEIVLPKIIEGNYEILKGNAEIITTETQILYLSKDPVIEIKMTSE